MLETSASAGKFEMCRGKRKLNSSISADDGGRIPWKVLVQDTLFL